MNTITLINITMLLHTLHTNSLIALICTSHIKDLTEAEMETYIFKELLGQLLDMVQHFVHVVLLLTDPRHLPGNELHKSEGEECKKKKLNKKKKQILHHGIRTFSQKLTSSKRSAGLYGGPLSDTKPANAMPSSTFIRKSSSESVLWLRKAAWKKKKKNK